MDQFIVNIIHRPELVPEYLDRTIQSGQTEEVSKVEVVSESLDIFRLQQECQTCLCHPNKPTCLYLHIFQHTYYQDQAL